MGRARAVTHAPRAAMIVSSPPTRLCGDRTSSPAFSPIVVAGPNVEWNH